MNCPSRTEEPVDAGYNQNPPHLSSDLTTTADLNGIVNARILRRISSELHPEEISCRISEHEPPEKEKSCESLHSPQEDLDETKSSEHVAYDPINEISSSNEPSNTKSSPWRRLDVFKDKVGNFVKSRDNPGHVQTTSSQSMGRSDAAKNAHGDSPDDKTLLQRVRYAIIKYGKFVGPGFMVSVAYIDPGNYSTDVAAGASYRFKLLFVVLMSNIFAVFLQSLCIKLGTITGMNLAENCRAHCPKWLNLSLYVLAEVAVSLIFPALAVYF